MCVYVCVRVCVTLQENSTAEVRAYRKTSEKFRITCGVCQGCVLAPTLFNLYFDVAIRTALDEYRLEEKGVNQGGLPS